MKKILYLLFTILTLNFSFSQNQEKQNEFCVINMLGGKLYEKPTFKSKVLTELKVGETLFAEKKIKSNETKNIGLNFSLTGNWIKTKSSGISGYVFSSDLTKLKPKITVNEYGQTFIELLGEILNERIEKKTKKYDGTDYVIEDEITEFENGTKIYWTFDSCFNYITKYSNLKINEVYHQMVSDYGGLNFYDKKYYIPVFQEKTGNIMKFEGEGATQDLQIEIKDNGIIKVSSYDCT